MRTPPRHLPSFRVFCLLAALLAPCGTMHATDIFSVNIYAYGRNLANEWQQESWRQTVRFDATDADQSAGVWETTDWVNVQASAGSRSITSSEGSTATFALLDQRNSSPYNWTTTRNDGDSVDVGNATLLDGHSVGTFDPGDSSNISTLQVSGIPFAAYDVIIYLGINAGQKFAGKGTIRFNGGPDEDFTLITTEPTGVLTEIVDATTPGNYIVYRGLSDPSFTALIWGDDFTHLGPAGFQIAEAERAREPLEVTDVLYDEGSDRFTLTWKSNPGDFYGIYWSDDLTGFVPGVNPSVAAHPTEFRTTYGPVASPSPGAEHLFFRVGPPDLEDPTLDRVWGNGTTVSLDFSEAMHPVLATDPARYAVTKDGGGSVAVVAADFHPADDTVLLTTASPLDPASAYTVTTNGLADVAGRSLAGAAGAGFRTWDNSPDGVRVFILAGQSNMVGYGKSEVGNGDVAGAIGSLRYEVNTDPANYGHLVDGGGNWIARSDVKVWWRDSDLGETRSVRKGDLTVGFGANSSWIGPEYGFGWNIGEYLDEPVLIIKACWGGKSLYSDFRPPSAVAARGGDVGAYYFGMFDYVHDALDDFAAEFPAWAGMGYQIAGFGWHQGWNDGGSEFTAGEYEANLVDLINDLRAEFGNPVLPVSIANTGIGGSPGSGVRLTIMEAQLAVGDPLLHPEYAGTVLSADTRPFWRASTVSPSDTGYHWNHNAETYFLIGDALGQNMRNLLGP